MSRGLPMNSRPNSSVVGPDNVAAFVAEPIVGATSGCVAADAGYFKAVRAICDRHGALLILDEIMSGMGRSGTQHVWEQEGVTPDLQAVAKGLGGGYVPLGALLVSGKVMERARTRAPARFFTATRSRHTRSLAPARWKSRRSSRRRVCSTM